MTKQETDFARECLELAGGDWAGAREIGVKRLNEDEETYGELRDDIVRTWLRTVIRGVAASERHQISAATRTEIAPAKPDDTSGIRAGVSRAVRSLYDTPLMGGKLLGDAVKADILAQVEMHQMNAERNAYKARWFGLIAGRMPKRGAKRVRQVLSVDELQKLQTEAEA